MYLLLYLPYYGVVDTTEELNKLSNNIFIFLFYLLYIFYFIFSGLQIKYGLSDLRKLSGLMKSSNLIHSVYYKVFKNIPFLYELKNFIDWTFTTTSLDLWKWLKLEEIISLLYINKCFAKGNMKRRIGTKIPVKMKILMGGSIFFGVLLYVKLINLFSFHFEYFYSLKFIYMLPLSFECFWNHKNNSFFLLKIIIIIIYLIIIYNFFFFLSKFC